GACGTAGSATPWDVVVGDLQRLQSNGGVVDLGPVSCVANEAAQDRVTVQTLLSDCRKSVFVLAKRGAGQQFDYGSGTGPAMRFAVQGGDCP
ncbi:MAG TPA: hypothetical protein VMT33_01110, partial [Candidatus Bathyarchaeia archaeon]|nr:hypothetical protein [Candidatus Bathyarchaeia archaeon]